MKRGQLPLESMAQIVLRVLAFVALIAILYMLVSPLWSSKKSPEEQDFLRVTNEIDDMMTQSYQGQDLTMKVPVTSSIQVVAYAGGSTTDPRCKGQPCICLQGGSCKIYTSLRASCPDVCGKVQCLKSAIGSANQGTITIKRGCNDVSFEGIQV